MKHTAINFKYPLQQDNVFVKTEVLNFNKVTGLPSRPGLEKVILSEGRIVNVVSNMYGHLPNEKFFTEVERKLIDADVNYVTRSINRDNRQFAVDYILDDERYAVTVKGGQDKIRPMLRFTNSYDGSCRTAGSFGFYREVCSNGLHLAEQQVGFKLLHRGDMLGLVMPGIKSLVNTFMDNEYYTLTRKFEELGNRQISDVEAFVKSVCERTKLFKFEGPATKNAGVNARLVMEIMKREALELNQVPNRWLAYNAFNEVLHTKMKKTFEQQRALDVKLFDSILELQ